MKRLFQWLSSTLVAVLVSCGAFAIALILYASLDLHATYGVEPWVSWLALVVGPAVMIGWHRRFHQSPGLATATLLGGFVLGGVGTSMFLRARQADAVHVPSGPFSGIEHVFAMGFGLVLIVMAGLAILGGLLSLFARRWGQARS